MKQIKIVYVIILIIVCGVFIYMNKNIVLEGYLHIPDVTCFSGQGTTVTVKNTYNNVNYDYCTTKCDGSCIGFTSNIPLNSEKKGRCILYNSGFTKDNLTNIIHNPGNNLYIK